MKARAKARSARPGRRRFSSGTRWEPIVGYSRAVRTGRLVHVSGTTATDERGDVSFPGDAYRQTLRAIENVRAALRALGADLADVVRTRMYVTDIDRWTEVGRAHGEVFGEIRPATSMVEVKRLVSPEMLVEIEADAVIERRAAPRRGKGSRR
ncbi:MAG: RidA family protein [Candidatus Binatia bacterium]